MATPRLTWDGTRYRNSDTGRFVPRATVRRHLELSLAQLNRRVESLAGDLRAGRVSLDAWRAEMRDIVKHTQLVSETLAQGGREQMALGAYGRVGQRVRTQYRFLDLWTEEIVAGTAPLDGRLDARGKLYLKSGVTAFHQAEGRTMRGRGFDEVRSILQDAEHCSECISEEAKGFQPIGRMVPIGQRQCLGNDRCTQEFRNSQTGEVIAA